MKKPVIGVAFGRPDYLAALREAGAEVRELSPDTDVLPAALAGLDGVMLTGGPDVRPSLYGAATTHPSVEINDARDGYELPLAKAAIESGLPLLAICRGVQVLNVAAGGTLIQDLPSEHPGGLNHSITAPTTALAHDVAVTPGSQLARALAPQLTGEGRLMVNSRHHQAIGVVAPGFSASAIAPDGTIEAIETATPQAHGFCVGVQWHPENFWRTGETASLFQSFVSAAARRG
ncbi:MAG: gamma-glutamyl-gamma-aminobutyrate hydrolase family protein [Acidobacteria bacterium]|nr:gamma-glutamyl-gamma-aminobutyrate hydrolase family protein [Acidobacteriota bacterium]